MSYEDDLREQLRRQEEEAARRAMTPKPDKFEQDARAELRKTEKSPEIHGYKPETDREREERQEKNSAETVAGTPEELLHARQLLESPGHQKGVEYRQAKLWSIRTLFRNGEPLWKLMRKLASHGHMRRTIKELVDSALLELIPDNNLRFNVIDIEFMKAFGSRHRQMQEEGVSKIRKGP